MVYKNPIIPGFYPDPSICRVGEWFYLVTSSFEYFPGIPLFKSRDLVNWEQIGHCLTRESQLNLYKVFKSGGVYAPTIRYSNGRFYMVTTNVPDGGNFYVYTDDIEGEWSEPVSLDIGGIDPSLFFDRDGKTYIMTNEGTDGTFGHIVLAELDIETGEILTDHIEIWKGTGGMWPEAPHIYFRDGYYYLMIAEGGTSYGHMVTISRSKDIFGPYESCPHNPILTHRERPNSPIQATGHGDLVEDNNGGWWIVFLGVRPSNINMHHLGRETFLAPVTWSEDGWPVVNNFKDIELEMDVDSSTIQNFEKSYETIDCFKDENLAQYWNYIRNPQEGNYEWGNGLILTGSEVTLSDVGNPVFLGRRQQHFSFRTLVEIDLTTLIEGDEAGITAFYSDEHHYDLHITVRGGLKCLEVRKVVADINTVTYSEVIEMDKILLSIKADKKRYFFGYGKNEAFLKYVERGRTQLLCTEVATAKFTGTYIGMYAYSRTQTPVTFNKFIYTPNI